VRDYIASGEVPYQEDGLKDITKVRWSDSIEDVVKSSELVFVAVQTPHDPAYEGVTPAPRAKRDFEYQFLANAYREVCRHVTTQTVAVISTVLPGTMQRVILPQGVARTVYNPFFIAMGTTTADFLKPEFVIVGGDDPIAVDHMRRFYKTIHTRPVVTTSIASAELVKVAYNGVISAKIVLANWVGEICEKTAADADEVYWALSHATERLWCERSNAHLQGVDGGAAGGVEAHALRSGRPRSASCWATAPMSPAPSRITRPTAQDTPMLTAKAARMWRAVRSLAWMRYSAMPKSRKLLAKAANTAATAMAQPMVMAPEPTAGPMLLATSLAPMFIAM
jgi:hypothetical protein